MTKHDIDPDYGNIDVEGLGVSYSAPAYTGKDEKRVGSTAVTLTFTLTDKTTLIKTETFNNIKTTTSQEFDYAIGYYVVTVRVTALTSGKDSKMNITGVTGEITKKVINQ